MQLGKNHIYHIYNRGNNSQIIFFNRENYLFFLKKLRLYITPFADILAWCLMPNHFHLMVYINKVVIEVSEQEILINNVAVNISEQVTSGHQLTRERTFNESLSILLRSYTRAINKQENRTGSLFQHRTKAICLTEVSGISPAWFQSEYGTIINIEDPEKAYPQTCFRYIHRNPVNAGITFKEEDWEFSSYIDYAGKRSGKLINRERAMEFGLEI